MTQQALTTKERARWLFRQLSYELEDGDLLLERHLLAAERAAAEAMRERCYKACWDSWHDAQDMKTRNARSHGAVAAMDAIRALPLEGDDADR